MRSAEASAGRFRRNARTGGDRRSKRTGGGAEFGPTWSSMSHWGLWRRWEPVEGYLALRPAFFFIDSRKR